MLDVKNYPHSQHTMLPHHPNDHHYVTNHYPPMLGGHQPVFICSRPTPTPLYCAHPTGQDLYNPVYEELSNGKYLPQYPCWVGDNDETWNCGEFPPVYV